MQAGEEIVVRAAERQVPQFVAIRIQTHQPIVGQANYGAGLVAVGAENRISTQDKSATTDLLKAIQGVAPAAAEGPIPELIAARVQAHDPKIIVAEIGSRLVAIGAGRGITAQDVSTIGGLLKALKGIARTTTEGQVPKHAALPVQTHHPEIVEPKVLGGLVAADAGAGTSSQNIPAVGCLLQTVEKIIVATAEGPLPDSVAGGVEPDQAGEGRRSPKLQPPPARRQWQRKPGGSS